MRTTGGGQRRRAAARAAAAAALATAAALAAASEVVLGAGARDAAPGDGDLAPPQAVPRGSRSDIAEFFVALDEDGDGQIEHDEAKNYLRGEVGGTQFDEAGEIERGASALLVALDSSADADETVSVDELDSHVRAGGSLRALLTVEGVADWVAHGLQLPQYAPAFIAAAVTALEFATIVNAPDILSEELGVTSTLHRQKILRALKWKLLDIGTGPGVVGTPSCSCHTHGAQVLGSSVAAGSVASVRWAPPEELGDPPTHGYEVQSASGGRWGGSEWVHAAVAEATPVSEVIHYVPPAEDRNGGAGPYPDALARFHAAGSGAPACEFRVRAWNFHSGGKWAVVQCCDGAGACVGSEGGVQEMPRHRGGGILAWVASLLRSLALNLVAIAAAVGLRWVARRANGSARAGGMGGSSEGDEGDSVRDGERGDGESSGEVGELAGARTATLTRPPAGPVSTRAGAAAEEATAPTPNGIANGTARAPSFPAGANNSTDGSAGGRWRRAAAKALDASRQRRRVSLAASGGSSRGVGRAPSAPSAVRSHCHAPSCDKEFKRFSLSSMTRHYCRDCQGVFCIKHTRYSPHGAFGECGLMSKCLCELCFSELPLDEQARLDATDNKLKARVKRRDKTT